MTGFVVGAFRRTGHGTGTVSLHALAGLAAIASGAPLVGAGGAIAIGVLAAFAAMGATVFTSAIKLHGGGIAFAVHGAPAIVGTLAFPVFMIPALGGPGFAEGTGLGATVAAQGVATLAIMVWTAIATVIAALMISLVAPMKRAG